jgi:bifunctional DNA-binding transcriptional regulator/antitoxin component of YhaV-PrlF toxin-antitoxin module
MIPVNLRKKYNLQPGDEVVFVDYGGVLAVVPVAQDAVEQGFGMLRGGPPLTEALLEERRKEKQHEQRQP